MFYEFTHRHVPCLLDGIPEKGILSREGRGNSIFYREYAYNAVFAPDSPAKSGGLLQIGTDIYLIRTMRPTVEGDRYCSVIKTNYQPEIKRLQEAHDNSGNVTGQEWQLIDAPYANIYHVNGNSSYKDGLLLPTTVFKATLQINVPVELQDRFIFDGKPYKCDDINLSEVPGLQVIQLSQDTRR